MDQLKRAKFDRQHFYSFNGKGCPRGAKNDEKDTKVDDSVTAYVGMPTYSPQMQPVDFDAWAWSIVNNKDFLPSGLKANTTAQQHFNKIWDGNRYRYVVNSDGKLCSVVGKDAIVERQRNTYKYKSQAEYLDQLEGSLRILLNNLGYSIDQSMSQQENLRRLKSIQRSASNADDSDIRLIRSMEQSDDIIKPGTHGCSPRQFFVPQNHPDRTRYRDLGTPDKLNINMRTENQELKTGHFGGRVPYNFNPNNSKDVSCVTGADDRLQSDSHRAAYHHMQELNDVPQTVRDRGPSVQTTTAGDAVPATAGELYSTAAVCAQQLTKKQCDDTLMLKVTPFGNEDQKAPRDLCRMQRHPVTNQRVCAPRQISETESSKLSDWYYGTNSGDGGFREKEQRLMEANHQLNNPNRRSPLISDDIITADDLADCEAIGQLRGVRRFVERHEAQKIDSNY